MSLANQMTVSTLAHRVWIAVGNSSRRGDLPGASCHVKSVRLKHEDAPKATFPGSWRGREHPPHVWSRGTLQPGFPVRSSPSTDLWYRGFHFCHFWLECSTVFFEHVLE